MAGIEGERARRARHAGRRGSGTGSAAGSDDGYGRGQAEPAPPGAPAGCRARWPLVAVVHREPEEDREQQQSAWWASWRRWGRGSRRSAPEAIAALLRDRRYGRAAALRGASAGCRTPRPPGGAAAGGPAARVLGAARGRELVRASSWPAVHAGASRRNRCGRLASARRVSIGVGRDRIAARRAAPAGISSAAAIGAGAPVPTPRAANDAPAAGGWIAAGFPGRRGPRARARHERLPRDGQPPGRARGHPSPPTRRACHPPAAAVRRAVSAHRPAAATAAALSTAARGALPTRPAAASRGGRPTASAARRATCPAAVGAPT
jgi:hypothetical protein